MRKRAVLFFTIIILIGLLLLSGYGEPEETPRYYNQSPGSPKADSLLSEVATWDYRGFNTVFNHNNFQFSGHGRYVQIKEGNITRNVTVEGRVRALYANDNYVYAAMGAKGLEVIDYLNEPPLGYKLDTPGLALDVYVSGSHAYVADYNANLRVIDISVYNAPVEVGYLDSPGYALGVHCDGDYAYVAAGPHGLRVVDISTPSSPALIGSCGGIGYSNSVFFDGSYAYVALASKPGQPGGISVIDVSTPETPEEIGFYHFSETNFVCREIVVSGQYAYVGGTDGLHVFNISNPALPDKIGGLPLSSASGISISGNTVYLACGTDYMPIVDVSVPSSPVQTGLWTCVLAHSYDVHVVGNYAYIAHTNEGMRVIDISNSHLPIEVAYRMTASQAYGIYISGNYAYVADNLYGLSTFGISNPTSPTWGYIPSSYPGSSHMAVYVSGNYAYVANIGVLKIINVSTPSNPVETVSLPDPDWATDVHVSGNHAYVADADYGLRVIDVTDPAAPVQIGSLSITEARSIYVSGNYAYISNGWRLRIIDISTPSTPTEKGFYAAADVSVRCACVQGNYAFVGTYDDGLRVIDVGDPASPVEVDYYALSRPVSAVDVVNGYAYVSKLSGGISIIDVSAYSSYIRVNSPNGGESLPVNSMHNITWTTTGTVGNVKIEYSADNGDNWTEITASTENDGNHPWTIPNTGSDNCVLRIGEINGSLSDTSDNVFSIVPPPTIDITAPNGGESWQATSQQTITWTSTGTVGNVKIEYSADNGNNWTEITADTENDGTHPWTIPDAVSANCLIRIGETDGEPSDTSDTVFSITPAPTITVSSPNGGESWMVGSNQNITWTSTGTPGNVKIEYSTDNGGNWAEITADTENDGTHPWTIPDAVSTNCLIRIGETDGVPSDTGDNVFSIVPIPAIDVISPNGGESWMVGSNQNITWTYTGTVGNVKIEYSIDNGGNWTEITASTENDGTYPWTVPDAVSTNCLVRVSETGGNPSDTSDNVFSIIPIPTIAVTAPNGGETWQAVSQQTITWTTTGTVGNVNIEYSADNGDNWTEITASTENDGSHPWTLPYTVSTQCLVRVGETDGSPLDISNSVFSIVPNATWIPGTERNVLIALYNATNGDNWTDNSGWKAPPLYTDGFAMPGTENDWKGITVSNVSGYHVINVTLSNNNLNGSIPPELGDLANLQYLYLNYNQLTGAVPSELGNLGSLRELYLNNNQLSGPIPTTLGNLGSLEYLCLNNNQLSGPIPPTLGNLTNLQHLFLSSNGLTGGIPSQLENLDNLITLSLLSNDLGGPIPPELGNMNRLQYLALNGNELTGNIPSQLENLDNLVSLFLQYNDLDGSIPPELGNINSLQYIDLSGNLLSGTIPPQLENLSKLKNLIIGANQLTGNIPPELGNINSLVFLMLTSNQLTGSIPPELGNLNSIKYLYLENNDLNGNIPIELANLGSLETLSLSNNQLNGSIPPGLENLVNLKMLLLGNNRITGSIPPEICNLVNLTSLQLHSNQLTGSIPSSLSNLINLSSSYTNIGYNALYTDDDNLQTFLNSKDSDWEATQTIAPTDLSAEVGSTDDAVEITWTPIPYIANTGSYQVFYGTAPGGPYSLFDTTANKTIDSMTVTGLTPGETYYFIIKTQTNPNGYNANTVVSDPSEEIFARAGPTITVTSPNGGESLDAGSVHGITWTSGGDVNNVIIDYSTDNGSSWKTVVQSTENDGIYNWNVPTAASDKCLVRISGSTSDAGPADTSDAVFSIVSPDPGSITLRSPNGGENRTVGTTEEIKWNSTGDINNVTIEYSRDNGTTWNVIAKSTTNDGGYNWKTPNTVSDKCRVRVTANDGDTDPVPSDMSDSVFSILRPTSPTLEVTTPNGGEQLAVGARYSVTWYTTNSRAEAVIEYSLDNGDSWTEIAAAAENDGEYDWTVPDTPSETCLIRISETGGDPVDISDAVFSIVSPLPSDIVVTAPNGGENWEAGSLQEIAWTAGGDINNVVIELSTDNGTTWENIVQTTANDGGFDWTVPDTASETCRVRVTADDTDIDPKPSDVSDSVFSIALPSSPTIRVTAPNGGEQLVVGSRFAITWFATDSRAEAKIEYSIDGGDNWTDITGTTPNDGEYDWTVPDVPSESCLVRISETGGQPLDISDAVFSIVPPLSTDITVTTPNGGESCSAGSSGEITWTCTGDIDNVTIEHSTDNGTTWQIVAQTTPNDGSYDWTVPGTPSEKCLVRITANDSNQDPKPSDVSDEVFSIVSSLPGDFRLTSPNGGESWEVGSTHAVTWSTSGNIVNVMLEYSTDDGVSWSTVVSSTTNGGTYDWMIPDTVSDQCRVRVTANDGGGDPRPSDESDSLFSIVRPSLPVIRVITPNGDEELVTGSTYEITWFATDSRAEVKIEYSVNGGETWTVIANAVENSGSYDWLVPDEPSETCLVRVSDTNGQPMDIGDAVFSIVSPPAGDLAVLTPNGGESLEAGSEYNITWSCGDLNNVFIEYSVNDGATWTYIDTTAAGGGSYTWTVPDTPSDSCLVRISGDDSAGDPSDVSDSIFSITSN